MPRITSRALVLVSIFGQLCLPVLALAQEPTKAVLTENSCAPEGVIVAGTFVRQIHIGSEGGGRPETITREFVLTCQSSRVLLRLRSDDIMLVISDVAKIADQTMLGDSRKMFIFSRTGDSSLMSWIFHLVGDRSDPALPRAEYDATLLQDLTFGANLLFGRVSFVAPDYTDLVPVLTPEVRQI